MKSRNSVTLKPGVRDVAERLSRCDGVVGVVLGGSRARGKGSVNSDIDLGVYYNPQRFSWDAVSTVLRAIDDDSEPNGLAPPGMWGPWMNGGGWLSIGGEKVDILLRDVDFVSGVINDFRAGNFSSHYVPGHPHGWHSFMLAGEVFWNFTLQGSLAELHQLKAKVADYPMVSRRAVFDRFGYEAQFTALLIQKLEGRDDLAQLRGLSYRGLICLAHVLCALNGTFVVNEKGLLVEAVSQQQTVEAFLARAEGLLQTTSPTSAEKILSALTGEVNELAQNLCAFSPSWTKRSFPHS